MVDETSKNNGQLYVATSRVLKLQNIKIQTRNGSFPRKADRIGVWGGGWVGAGGWGGGAG